MEWPRAACTEASRPPPTHYLRRAPRFSLSTAGRASGGEFVWGTLAAGTGHRATDCYVIAVGACLPC